MSYFRSPGWNSTSCCIRVELSQSMIGLLKHHGEAVFKTSSHTVDGRYPAKYLTLRCINTVHNNGWFSISTGAGILPSTVCIWQSPSDFRWKLAKKVTDFKQILLTKKCLLGFLYFLGRFCRSEGASLYWKKWRDQEPRKMMDDVSN